MRTCTLAITLCCSTLLAQRQFAEQLREYMPRLGIDCRTITCGDVDGDGDVDVLIATGDQDRLLLNNGDGTFVDGTARLPAQQNDTEQHALADFDGDGDLDILGAGRTGPILRNLWYYENDGLGNFVDESGARFPVRGYLLPLNGVEVFDGDADGDLDILVLQDTVNNYNVNDGTGHFSNGDALLPVHRRTFLESVDADTGDVDGDGDLDIVIVNDKGAASYSGTGFLFLNDGTGRYTDGTAQLPRIDDYSKGVTLIDIDGDGDLDIFTAADNYFGRGSSLLLNDGSGQYTEVTAQRIPGTMPPLASPIALDADGDGDMDILAVELDAAGAPARMFVNEGGGFFYLDQGQRVPSTAGLADIATADVDGDADLDVVLAFGTEFGAAIGTGLFLNDSLGEFADATGLRTSARAFYSEAVATGDLDADGDLDLIFGSRVVTRRQSTWRTRVQLNDGFGAFTDVTEAAVSPTYTSADDFEIADFDGDNDLDIVSVSDFTRALLSRNDGTGQFGATVQLTTGSNPESVAGGDVDGDGDRDLLFGTPSQDALYLNDGSGNFTDVTGTHLPSVRTTTGDVALADVDGDGDLDAILAGEGTFGSQNRLLLNDGTGVMTESFIGLPAQSEPTVALAVGDVDGDGDVDLVAGNAPAFPNRLYFNDGSGVFQAARRGELPADAQTTESLLLADLDEDGDLDLIVANGKRSAAEDGRDRLYLNDGAGTFTDATDRLPEEDLATSMITAADIDCDGDLDLIVARSDGTYPNSIWINRLRQGWAPRVIELGARHRTEFTVRPGFAPAGQFVVPFLGASLLSEPVQLGQLGKWQLTPSPVLFFPAIALAPVTGHGVLDRPILNIPALLSQKSLMHALALPDPDPATWRFTNLLREPIVN